MRSESAVVVHDALLRTYRVQRRPPGVVPYVSTAWRPARLTAVRIVSRCQRGPQRASAMSNADFGSRCLLTHQRIASTNSLLPGFTQSAARCEVTGSDVRARACNPFDGNAGSEKSVGAFIVHTARAKESTTRRRT
jgi:hypothetical protein